MYNETNENIDEEIERYLSHNLSIKVESLHKNYIKVSILLNDIVISTDSCAISQYTLAAGPF